MHAGEQLDCLRQRFKPLVDGHVVLSGSLHSIVSKTWRAGASEDPRHAHPRNARGGGTWANRPGYGAGDKDCRGATARVTQRFGAEIALPLVGLELRVRSLAARESSHVERGEGRRSSQRMLCASSPRSCLIACRISSIPRHISSLRCSLSLCRLAINSRLCLKRFESLVNAHFLPLSCAGDTSGFQGAFGETQ